MNSENPRISVVIPVKNAEGIISQCLKAVFSQSCEPYEVVIVDGHSTDKTVEKAKEFPVKIVYEDYNTVGGARHVGLESVVGEYVAFTDADCIPEKDWLKNLVEGFFDEVVGVGGGVKNVGKGLWKKSNALIMDSFAGSANSVQGRLFKEKRFVKSISGCNSMYSRTALIETGGFDVALSINEDTELNKRLSKIGKLLYTPDAIVLHNPDRGLRDFANRMYQFGCGRGRLRLWDLQCIPPIIASLVVLSLVFSHLLFAGVVGLYVFILIVLGFKFAIHERDIRYLGSIPIVYVVQHSSYAIGFWKGILVARSWMQNAR